MNGNRIGILCSSVSAGGLEQNTLRLAGWLREQGWKPTLLLSTESPMVPMAQSAGLDYQRLPPARGLMKYRSRAKAISRWLKTAGAPLLLVTYNKDLAAAALCKRFFNRSLKIVYQQHMRVGIPKRDAIHTWRYAAIDAWVSPLPYLKEETLKLTRLPERKISVIPFGIETAPFREAAYSREAARAELALPQDAAIIGVLGRLDRFKGQDFVLRAVQRWNEQHPARPFQLLIMGDATREEEGQAFAAELRRLIETAGLAGTVHLRPHRPDVRLFFSAVDIFAMPSYFETFGMVTIEAMAAGLPVIGADAGGTAALLESGRLGYLYSPKDEAGFNARLLDLIQNEDLLQMLQQAREKVDAHYSKEAMVSAFDALLRRLL